MMMLHVICHFGLTHVVSKTHVVAQKIANLYLLLKWRETFEFIIFHYDSEIAPMHHLVYIFQDNKIEKICLVTGRAFLFLY